MHFKAAITLLSIALVAVNAATPSTTKNDEKSAVNGQKNKRGLIEFGYGYGIDDSDVDFDHYAYIAHPAPLSAPQHSVVSRQVLIPPVTQQHVAIPIEQYIKYKVPTSYSTTINRIQHPSVDITKPKPVLLKIAQPYSVSYVQHHVSPQVRTVISDSAASPQIIYDKYSKLDKYSSVW